MNVSLSDQEFDDFDKMVDAWKARRWDAEYLQLAPGQFHGRLLQSAIGSSTIYRDQWASRIQHRGAPPEGTVFFAPTLSSKGAGRFEGATVGPLDVIVTGSRKAFELIGASTWDAAVFELREASVAEEVASITQWDPAFFQELLDISPAAYLKAQRLNRARQALRISDPSEATVKQIAYAHGFWHLGQFASDYKRFFGERPSQTLTGSLSRKARRRGLDPPGNAPHSPSGPRRAPR